MMSLSRIRVEHFTAFDTLDLDFSPGVNVLVGANEVDPNRWTVRNRK